MAIIKLTRSKHREYYSRLAGDNGESVRKSDIREHVINNRERKGEREIELPNVIFQGTKRKPRGYQGVSLPIGSRAGFAGYEAQIEQAEKCTRHDQLIIHHRYGVSPGSTRTYSWFSRKSQIVTGIF